MPTAGVLAQGALLFVFNFHTSQSYMGYKVLCPAPAGLACHTCVWCACACDCVRTQNLIRISTNINQSNTNFKVGCRWPGKYKIVLDSDWAEFGGHERNDRHTTFFTGFCRIPCTRPLKPP